MPINKATQKLFNRFAFEDGLLPRDAILIGGTALALIFDHRDSEDLDFAFVGKKLPAAELATCINRLQTTSKVQKIDVSDWEKAEWDDALLDIDDHFRTYTVDGIKVQFFIPEYANILLDDPGHRIQRGHVSMATPAELFALKSIILERTVRQRDVFDLHWMMTRGGKSFSDVKATFDKTNPLSFGNAINRLLHAKFKMSDPGYHQLIGSHTPIDTLREELAAAYDAWEKQYAAIQMQQPTTASNPSLG